MKKLLFLALCALCLSCSRESRITVNNHSTHCIAVSIGGYTDLNKLSDIPSGKTATGKIKDKDEIDGKVFDVEYHNHSKDEPGATYVEYIKKSSVAAHLGTDYTVIVSDDFVEVVPKK